MRALSLFVIIFGGASFCAADTPAPSYPIVGTWRFSAPQYRCVETWQYRADGTTHSSSGAEESESRYEIAPLSSKTGVYQLVDTVTSNNGQPDCTGHRVPVGDRATLYLVPYSDEQFKVCVDLRFLDCIGTMVRLSKPGS